MKTIFRFALAPACALLLGTAHAEDAVPQAAAAASSLITGAKLPAGALRLQDASTPAEVERALSLMLEADKEKAKRGRSEVLVWGEPGHSAAKSKSLMSQVAAAMKRAGWKYEMQRPEGNGDATMVRATQQNPLRRVVVGYWVSSDKATLLAWAEAIVAQAKPPVAKRDATLDEPLAQAIEAKDAAKVAELLEQGADANGRAQGGHTFLMRAINGGAPEVTQALLDAGADPEVAGIASGETPLFMAALMGQNEIVAQLLSKGADVNAKVPQSGLTALHGTVYGAYPETARQLLEAGADPKARDKNGKTPRQIAEQSDKTELADLLREAEEKNTPNQ